MKHTGGHICYASADTGLWYFVFLGSEIFKVQLECSIQIPGPSPLCGNSHNGAETGLCRSEYKESFSVRPLDTDQRRSFFLAV